jgi:hypothetical protein
MGDERRREPRYNIRNAELIEVSLQQDAVESGSKIVALLGDLSRHGMRLQLPEPLTIQESASLVLRSEQLKFELSLCADICWMRPEKNGQWSLGVEFVPELPHAVMQKLMDSGVIERRESPRQTWKRPVRLRWEPDMTEHQAVLWDISKSGFCILSPHRATRKAVVLGNDGGGSLSGTTQWQLTVSEGYLVGCCCRASEGRMWQSEIGQVDPAVMGAAGLAHRLKCAVCGMLRNVRGGSISG